MAFWRRRTHGPDPSSVPGPNEDAGDDVEAAAASSGFDALLDREWDRLAHAGTWFTGTERVAIAAAARDAVHDRSTTGVLPDATAEATRRVATHAATIRPVDIERWAEGGLDGWAYVEVVGIVSRLMALDATAFGLGRPEAPLPEPVAGEPSRIRPDDAELTTGWVPTVGPASAPSSLTAVTAEHDAMFDIHGELYLTIHQMGDLEIVRDGLGRPQMELVAARTSMLNDCFY